MSDWLVHLVKLAKVGDHPNGDNLSITTVYGQPVILRRGSLSKGDLAVFVPPDSVLPTNPESPVLKDSGLPPGHRVEARRLRGIFSNGFLIPAREVFSPADLETIQVGDHVAERLGITKYEDAGDKLATTGENERDHGYMPVYTDLDGFAKYRKVIKEGEEVVLTEKIHGCVPFDAPITLVDGTRKHMNQIRVGDYVMGVDAQGKAVPSQVLETFDNGKAEKWLKISGKRIGAGRGNNYFALTCTPNHEVFCNGKYIPASQIKPGDKVTSLRTDLGLSPSKMQVLLGKLLGDGSLSLHPTAKTAHVTFSHRFDDQEYLGWTREALGELDSGTTDVLTSGFGTNMVRGRTINNFFIREKFESFLQSGQKQVPEWVADELTPLAMAFWYMDDGSLGHHDDQEDRVHFAVCGFNDDSCTVLLRGLARLGIQGQLYKSGSEENHNRIRLNADEAEKFFLMVAPYIPPSMQRKLPLRYRGSEGWIPSSISEYKTTLVSLVVDSVEETPKQSSRYDIKTETKNYFANGILIHNCNGRFCYRDGRLWVGSRTCIKAPYQGSDGVERNLWWKVAKDLGLEGGFALLPRDGTGVMNTRSTVVLFGEVYGQVQDLRYGIDKGASLRVFDTYNVTAGRYNDWDETLSICKKMGLETVPELYRGPWKPELEELRNGPSVLYPGHIREGFVVKPTQERYVQFEPGDRHAFTGRVIFKFVGEDYKTRKKKG